MLRLHTISRQRSAAKMNAFRIPKAINLKKQLANILLKSLHATRLPVNFMSTKEKF